MPFISDLRIPDAHNPENFRDFEVTYDYAKHPADPEYAFLGVLCVKHKGDDLTSVLSTHFKIYLTEIIRADLKTTPPDAETLAANDACMADTRAESEIFQAWLANPKYGMETDEKPESSPLH